MEKELEVTLTVKVKAALEDSEATEQTVRFLIEEDLRDKGWDADVYVRNTEPFRHGKYIGTEFDGYADGCPVYYEWKCSECGCVFEEEEPTYNYCPYCGAKMDGAERKEE